MASLTNDMLAAMTTPNTFHEKDPGHLREMAESRAKLESTK